MTFEEYLRFLDEYWELFARPQRVYIRCVYRRVRL